MCVLPVLNVVYIYIHKHTNTKALNVASTKTLIDWLQQVLPTGQEIAILAAKQPSQNAQHLVCVTPDRLQRYATANILAAKVVQYTLLYKVHIKKHHVCSGTNQYKV